MKAASFISATALALLAGCAGRQEVSVLAGRTSAVLNDYRQEMTTFARNQTRLRQENQRRLGEIGQAREQDEAIVARTLLGWRLGNDEDAIAMFGIATQMQADAIARDSEALQAARPAAATAAPVRFDAAQVEAVVTRLRALQQPQSLWDRMAFGLAYSQALHAAYRKSLQDAGHEDQLPAAVPTPASGSQPNH